MPRGLMPASLVPLLRRGFTSTFWAPARGSGAGQFRGQAYDVTVDDLGGKRLAPATLSQAEQYLLFGFLKMADKAAAHFTIPIVHDWSKTHDVIKLVHAYLKSNLHDIAGRVGLEALT